MLIHRPQRYRTLMGFLLGLILCTIVFGVIYFYYLNNSHEISEQEKTHIRDTAIEEFKNNHPTKLVYALIADKKSGEVLSDQDITPAEINADLVPPDAVIDPSLAVGKVIRCDIRLNTIITASLYYEEKDYPDDMRLMEYTVIYLPQKLECNEFIDIRVMFPNGLDYIVLSKKKVIDLQKPTTDTPNSIIWVHVVEEEILRMASAIVDASLVENTLLYAVPYVAPDIQEEAIRTYPINLEVQNLILKNPNIVNKAVTELEARNRKLFEERINENYQHIGKNKVFADDSHFMPSEAFAPSSVDAKNNNDSDANL